MRYKPQYMAKEAVKIYTEGADDIFRANGWPLISHALLILLFAFIFGVLFYGIGKYCYNHPKKWKAFKDMEEFLEENTKFLIEKKILKKQETIIRASMV